VPEPETIISDATRLRQILLNLVGNAIKFSEEGEVRLRTQLITLPLGQSALRFDVVDRGIGMTAEQIERLFQPFTQADASTARKYGGSGLGLMISKRLAETLGGDIRVESQMGGGSTFSVTIPTGPLDRVRMVSNPGDTPAVERTNKPLTGAVKLDCNILLAEDSPDNQDLVTFVLEKCGARVTVVENGADAVAQALAAQNENRPFDVILMDMQMPVLDGYGASRQLRHEGYNGPIIALTAHAMQDDLQRCLDAGCNGFATKPIDGRLLELIAAHVRVASPAAQEEACGARAK